jgi:hypothetical protein
MTDITPPPTETEQAAAQAGVSALRTDLIGLREAQEQVGLSRWSTQLEKLEAEGQVTLVRIPKGNRTYVYIAPEELEKAKGLVTPKPPRVRKPVVIEPLNGTDPLPAALDALDAALKNVRAAMKQHDRSVRFDTITNIATSLQEGASK